MPTDQHTVIAALQAEVRPFFEACDCDEFHSPRDLAIGIATEDGEQMPVDRAMRTPRFPWVVIVIVLVLAGCGQDRQERQASLPWEACFPDGPTLTYTLPPERSVLEAEPLQMMDALQPPPLKPDRRILFAVAEVDRLLTGADPGEVHAEAGAGGWQLRYRGERVGDLPAIPDFDEALEFLEAWTLERARQERVRFPLSIDQAELASIEADVADFHSMQVARGLARLDELWRESGGDAGLLAPAAGEPTRPGADRRAPMRDRFLHRAQGRERGAL